MNFVNNQSQGPSELQPLNPHHRMSCIFGYSSSAAKNIQQVLYKENNILTNEDLNTRHYLCCQPFCCSLFVMSGKASLVKRGQGFKGKNAIPFYQ